MNLLLYKLTLAPLLVVLATLAGRRWGETAAGLVAGFPIVAGPILWFFALEQGPVYAASAAQATLLGIFSLSLYALGYGWRAWAGGTALSCVILGWLAFAVATWLLGHASATLGLALFWAVGSLFLARRSMPPLQENVPDRPPSRWDLPLRAVAAAVLVFGLTHFAQALGPRWGGFLTPFPVASTVLAVFAHRQKGGAAAVAMLKGMLWALNSFAVFCAVLCFSLPRYALGISFGLALAAALAVQAALFRKIQKR